MENWNAFFLFLIISGIMGYSSAQAQKQEFQPTYESLEKSNPVPEWFKDAKFGIYFHWGVFSVPAFANEWYPRTMYIKGSAENKHHVETYGDIPEWPYNNFITREYQHWDVVKKTVKPDAGEHILKVIVDSDGINLDKMFFEEIK